MLNYMNTAIKNLTLLLAKIPMGHKDARAFIEECIKVWNEYPEMSMSWPEWQLRALEKKHGFTVSNINRLYGIK